MGLRSRGPAGLKAPPPPTTLPRGPWAPRRPPEALPRAPATPRAGLRGLRDSPKAQGRLKADSRASNSLKRPPGGRRFST
eukprot:5507893-Pyramimonas_sp.AAC.1